MPPTDLMFPFKLHGIRVAQGFSVSRESPKFYSSYDAALEAARDIVATDPNCQGIVIYEAVAIVRRERTPTQVEYLPRSMQRR